jgi:hypothetical protein
MHLHIMKHYFINIMFHSNMFKPLKVNLQEVELMLSASKVNKMNHQS